MFFSFLWAAAAGVLLSFQACWSWSSQPYRNPLAGLAHSPLHYESLIRPSECRNVYKHIHIHLDSIRHCTLPTKKCR
jgi:hypothetical protein